MNNYFSRMKNLFRKPKDETEKPALQLQFDTDGTSPLLESLQKPRSLSLEEIFREVRKNIRLAELCRKEGIPLIYKEDGSVDIYSSIQNRLMDPKERNILNIYWGAKFESSESRATLVLNNNPNWFYAYKEVFKQIVRENPELEQP